MKALLIWPKFESFSFWNFEKVCELTGSKYMTPPLGLATVAALLPAEWELRLTDENVRLTSDADIDWADVVFIGSKIVSRRRALALVERAREHGKTVVVGGPDATLNEAAYREGGANYLCLGEAELTIPRLLSALASGAEAEGVVLRAMGMADLSSTPPPRFDLLNLRDYLYVGLQFSRGCPYNCEFCNVIDIFDGYRTKAPEQVIAELDLLYASGYRGQVDFFDDNFAGNMKAAKVMLRAIAEWLEKHDFPFTHSTSVTLNIAKDEELLKLFRAARFKFFLIGIETPSKEALVTAQKAQNVGFSIPEAVDRIYRLAGATVHSGFLIGMDGEPDDIADRTMACIDATSIPWVMASIVYPLPGTQLSKRLKAEGRLFPSAEHDLPVLENGDIARDQISAGVQFTPQRDPAVILDDLLRIMEHSFDPERYFARCADVAVRLDTLPKLYTGSWIFYRNLRTALRLTARSTLNPAVRGPFWRAAWKVMTQNPAGIEALMTLAVLHTHFESMIPYCRTVLTAQKKSIEEVGTSAWLARRLAAPAEPIVRYVPPPPTQLESARTA